MNLTKLKSRLKPETNMLAKALDMVDSINSRILASGLDAKAVLGGSIAKGTNLKGDFDADIFVAFDMKYKSDDLSKYLQKILKSYANVVLLHGSRDYYQIHRSGMKFEIIPVLAIKDSSESVNITDVSPLHAEWVGRNINGLNDDVRLAKKFCKCQGVYGAESHINGFSGYILEILTINYGGFLNLLKAATKWKSGEVIDLAGHYKSRSEVYKKLNVSKLQSAIIVIDPVQKDRNAAASINLDSFSRFILASHRYLLKPSRSFFEHSDFSVSLLKSRAKGLGVDILLFNLEVDEGKEDIIGSKILKTYNYIKKYLHLHEFSLLGSGWNWNSEVYLWYFVYPKSLPKFKKHPGPIIYSSEVHVKSFLQKHQETFVEDGRLYALTKRQYTNAYELAKRIIKDDYVTDKVKSITLLK